MGRPRHGQMTNEHTFNRHRCNGCCACINGNIFGVPFEEFFHQNTRLQPTPTGPGICPVITSSQHTQYFFLHFAFSGMASHRIFGIWVQSTAMNVPGVYFGVSPRKLLSVSDQGVVNAFVVHCSTSWSITLDDASVAKAERRIITQRSMLGVRRDGKGKWRTRAALVIPLTYIRGLCDAIRRNRKD
jgi:hypothetical protein